MAANREHRGGRQHSPTPLPLPLARTSSSQRWNRLTEDRGQPRAGPPGTAQPPGVPERTGNRRSPLATRPYNYRLSPAHGSAARRALSPAEAARGLATGGPRTLPGSRPTARAPSEGRRRRPLPRRCGGETPPWPRRGRRLFRRRLRVLRGSASRRAGPGGASCGSEGRPGRPAGARWGEGGRGGRIPAGRAEKEKEGRPACPQRPGGRAGDNHPRAGPARGGPRLGRCSAGGRCRLPPASDRLSAALRLGLELRC